MSAPFYTSEKMESHGNNTFDWLEINCQLILKSTQTSVCIRVWEHMPTAEECTPRGRSDELLRARRESTTPPQSGTDKMLFIWGVYFSGLICLTKRSEAKFNENSLSFQMHGGYFASPASLTQETMRQQLALNYKMDQKILSSNSSSPANSQRSSSASSSVERASRGAVPKSCDIFSNLSYSDLVSPRASSHPSTTSTVKHKSEKDFQINSPRSSRSCSPVRSTDDRPNYPGQVDLSRDLLSMLKIRYIEKSFRASEIRPSYNVEKLLKIQQLQREYKHLNEHSKEITEKICMKSAFCLNLDLITSKGFLYRPRGNPSMGRTLNRLLFQENQVKPEDILKAQDLKRQIEIARFRHNLLSQERENKRSQIEQLEKRLNKLHDYNIESGSWLMSRYRNLGREKEGLAQERISVEQRKEVLQAIDKALRDRRMQLLHELKDIYPIRRRSNGSYAIHNVTMPNALDSRESSHWSSSADGTREIVSPLAYSVALGYVAHVVQMCSVILDLSLRNPIKHDGSRSRILDVIKDIPNAPREFPLYSRTNPPPNVILYAVYLLNQNIAQLNFQVYNIKCDIRATLANLLTLLNGPPTPSILTPSVENGTDMNETLTIYASASGSSIELNVPIPSQRSYPIDVVDAKVNDQRISRSVGSSYSDDQLSANNGKHFHSSEPILSIHNNVHLTTFSENGDV